MSRYERSYSGEHRSEFVGFYVTPSELGIIESAAKKRGASVNIAAREFALERAAARPTRHADFARQLAATMR